MLLMLYFYYIRGYNLVVECCASDPTARVRFPLPTPKYIITLFKGIEKNIKNKKATEVILSPIAF